MRKLNKKALVTGFTGQDGRYLAQYLLSLGYQVDGMFRRVSHPDWSFIDDLGLQDVNLIQGDLSDSISLRDIVESGQYDEIYNLAAMSHVGTSFNQPEYTIDVTGLGVVRLLEQIRRFSPHSKLYSANSSEQYGEVSGIMNEDGRLEGRSPYGAAKILAHNMCKIYRDAYNLFICCGILFNHDGEARSVEFVTRKVTDYVARYKLNLHKGPLSLGNLNAKRDWGYCKDYCKAMHLMMQHDKPDDYVIATGETHSVRELVELSFARIGVLIKWRGEGVDEVAINAEDKDIVVKIDPKFYRPAEVPFLLGDASKAKRVLGWEPEVKFKELVNIMVDYDLRKYSNDLSIQETYNK